MKKIGTLLLMTLWMSMGLAAQSAQNAPKPDSAAAEARDLPPKTEVSAPAAVSPDTKPAPAEAAAVSTSASSSFSPLPSDASTPAAIPAASLELQSEIQEALKKEPLLSKCSLAVAASAGGIDLTGSAGSSRERLAAWRLAQSYAHGMKVENHIVVSHDAGAAAPAPRPETPAPAANPTTSTPPSPGTQNIRQ